MELKKYVLLKDNRVVEIYKKEKFGYSYVDKEIDGIVFTRSILISDVKKTSDNILDLVEVGDLIDDGNTIMRVAQYENGVFFDGDSYTCQEGFVKAIYKRQANGDYKRYEVGGGKKIMKTFEKSKNYNLDEVSLEALFDAMIERDCFIQVGTGYEHGGDKITLHVFKVDGVYYFCIYDEVKSDYDTSYKTKKGALNRIKKHIKNGDISNVARLF